MFSLTGNGAHAKSAGAEQSSAPPSRGAGAKRRLCVLFERTGQALHGPSPPCPVPDLMLVVCRAQERRIDAAVTDQCYTLLYKIDSLNKQLTESAKALQVMESTVREQVDKAMRGPISDEKPGATRV